MSLTNFRDAYNPIYKGDMRRQLDIAHDYGATVRPFKGRDPLNLHEINRIDYIDLCEFSQEDKHQLIIESNDNYMDDYFNNRDISDEYFFKDFIIREYVDDDSGQMRYWVFNIQNDKYLNLDVYTIYPDYNTRVALMYDLGVQMLLVNYTFVWSILTHVLDEFYDNKRAFAKETFDLLAELGVKIRMDTSKDIYYYLDDEFNDWYFNYDQKVYYPANEYGRNVSNMLKKYIVETIACGYARFSSINNYLLRSVENNEAMTIIDDEDLEDDMLLIKEYVDTPDPTCDKNIIVDIGRLKTWIKSSDNIRRFRHSAKRSYKYKFQVRGHKHHYWVGSGPDRHLEERFIKPYYKNKDKPFKIIKKLEDSDDE